MQRSRKQCRTAARPWSARSAEVHPHWRARSRAGVGGILGRCPVRAGVGPDQGAVRWPATRSGFWPDRNVIQWPPGPARRGSQYGQVAQDAVSPRPSHRAPVSTRAAARHLSEGEPPAHHGSEQATAALPETSQPPSALRVILRQSRCCAASFPAMLPARQGRGRQAVAKPITSPQGHHQVTSTSPDGSESVRPQGGPESARPLRRQARCRDPGGWT
jgi:hypothetical protein